LKFYEKIIKNNILFYFMLIKFKRFFISHIKKFKGFFIKKKEAKHEKTENFFNF